MTFPQTGGISENQFPTDRWYLQETHCTHIYVPQDTPMEDSGTQRNPRMLSISDTFTITCESNVKTRGTNYTSYADGLLMSFQKNKKVKTKTFMIYKPIQPQNILFIQALSFLLLQSSILFESSVPFESSVHSIWIFNSFQMMLMLTMIVIMPM